MNKDKITRLLPIIGITLTSALFMGCYPKEHAYRQALYRVQGVGLKALEEINRDTNKFINRDEYNRLLKYVELIQKTSELDEKTGRQTDLERVANIQRLHSELLTEMERLAKLADLRQKVWQDFLNKPSTYSWSQTGSLVQLISKDSNPNKLGQESLVMQEQHVQDLVQKLPSPQREDIVEYFNKPRD